MQDYYATLGVTRSSSQDEIRKAYRSLVKKHHPDKFAKETEKEAANKKFQEIQAAYDILSDEKKKQMYDQYGHENYTKAETSGGFGQGGFDGFGASGFGGFDIFNDLFSQFGGSQEEYSRAQRGEDLRYSIEIDLLDAFKGLKTKIRLPRMIACGGCNGVGVDTSSKATTCATCKGSGRFVRQQMFLNIQQVCPYCHGKGKVQAACTKCGGHCRINQKSELEIEIPKGVSDGVNLRMQRQGNAGVEGGSSGDLFISIKVKKHALFEVDGNNLICAMPIDLPTAVLGGEVEVPTIDGEAVRVNVSSGSQHGTKIKIAQKGMPAIRGTSRGDMYVKLEIEIPTSLSLKEKTLWKDLKTESKNSPKSSAFFNKVKDFFSK